MTIEANKLKGDVLKAVEYNQLAYSVLGLLESAGPNAIMDSSGLHIRRMPAAGAIGSGLLLAKIHAISDDTFEVYLLDKDGKEEGDIVSVHVFNQGQPNFDLKTTVIPRYKVGDTIPVFLAIDESYYTAQTFIYVGEDKSIQWADPAGVIDESERAYANFRDEEIG